MFLQARCFSNKKQKGRHYWHQYAYMVWLIQIDLSSTSHHDNFKKFRKRKIMQLLWLIVVKTLFTFIYKTVRGITYARAFKYICTLKISYLAEKVLKNKLIPNAAEQFVK